MFSRLIAELAFFRTQPHDFRILSLTNMTYALVSPVIDIFVSAYIMRSSHDPTKVVVYQLAIYTGIPLTFLLNGFLLKRCNVRTLFSLGMLLSGVSMLTMMALRSLSIAGLCAAGLIMGASFGFYWANRDTLAVAITEDRNRNYYYGLDTFTYTTTSILVPLAVGWFIHAGSGRMHVHGAYLAVVAASFGMTVLATLICFRGRFGSPATPRFLHVCFHPLWTRLLRLALLKGLGQGFLVTAPSMLVMTLLGDEAALGTVQTVGGLVAALAMYVLGRVTGPADRTATLTIGLVLFVLAAAANAVLFDAVGVVLFMLLLLLSRPMMDLAYYPIQFRVIDIVKRIEGRSEYSYIFSHEAGLYVGRLVGAAVFLLLAYFFSTAAALRYAVLLISVVQLPEILIARRIVAQGDMLDVGNADNHMATVQAEAASAAQSI